MLQLDEDAVLTMLPRLHQIALLLLMAACSYWITRFLWLSVADPNVWTYGDWMTSYAAGFARRGLSGTVLKFASEFFGISTRRLFVSINLALYAIVSILIIITYWRASASVILFLFLPTSLVFLIWDPAIIGRKDTLLIALAFTASLIMRHGQDRERNAGSWLALSPVLAVLVLMHESFLFFVPLIVVATYAGRGTAPTSREMPRLVLAATLLPGITFLIVAALRQPLDLNLLFDFLGPDGMPLREACRSSRMDAGPDAWRAGGSICYLNTPISHSLRHVWRNLNPLELAGSFVTSAALLLSTATYFIFLTTNQITWQTITFWIVLGILATLPLYAVAIDWGRWLYLTTMIFAANLPPRNGAARVRIMPSWVFCATISALSLVTVSHMRSPIFTMRGLDVAAKFVQILRPSRG